MLGMVDGFVQRHRDVAVEQGVDHGPAGPLPGDQAEVTHHPELLGYRRLLHADGGASSPTGAGALPQAAQDRSADGWA